MNSRVIELGAFLLALQQPGRPRCRSLAKPLTEVVKLPQQNARDGNEHEQKLSGVEEDRVLGGGVLDDRQQPKQAHQGRRDSADAAQRRVQPSKLPALPSDVDHRLAV